MTELNDRQRRALKMLGGDENTTGLVLELAIQIVEAMTPEGAIDIAQLAPNVREAFGIVMRKRVEGLTRIQRTFATPKIIDSRDPGNWDPLGILIPPK